jgi:hypothetical protein
LRSRLHDAGTAGQPAYERPSHPGPPGSSALATRHNPEPAHARGVRAPLAAAGRNQPFIRRRGGDPIQNRLVEARRNATAAGGSAGFSTKGALRVALGAVLPSRERSIAPRAGTPGAASACGRATRSPVAYGAARSSTAHVTRLRSAQAAAATSRSRARNAAGRTTSLAERDHLTTRAARLAAEVAAP